MRRLDPECFWWSALVVAITLVVYWPSLRGGFVWDDSLIVHNRIVAAADGLYRFWFTTQAPDYYPLTWSLWWAEWRWWGTHPLGYHVVNVVLHAVNAILIAIVLRRLKIPGSWFAALVFAVHPVNVATVAWVSEQKNTVSMLFYLASILLYLRFDEREGWGWYVASLISFLLALLSKTAVVMLPVVVLGCLWWRYGRIRWKDGIRIAPFFLVALALGLVTVWFQSHQVIGGLPIRTDSFLKRLVTAGWIPWFYLYKDFWPCDLCVVYTKWTVDTSHMISYLPGIALVLALGVFWWKRSLWGRAPLFGLGYFVATLFPVLGFFDQGFYSVSLVADHWQYCSITGVIALAVAAGAKVFGWWGRDGRYAGVLVGAVVLAILGNGARTRTGVYLDSRALWEDTLAKNPKAWLAHNNLGYLLAGDGELGGAARHYEEAIRLNPSYAAPENNLGTVLMRLGRTSEAIGHFARAVEIEPDWAATHNNLGIAFLQSGEAGKAVDEFRQAIHYSPDYAEAYYNLGNALVKAGRKQDAMVAYERATALNPNFAQAYNNQGVLLQPDRLAEALRRYERALEIDPDYAEAHFNLGNALIQSGETNRAIAQYREALRLRPDHLDARYDLGVLLADEGHYDDAIHILQGGLTAGTSSPRFRQAIDAAQQALAGGGTR
ncbi:MAG TPA: tetratricopeptide repeat protein [Verrucomicrobiae bacterium]|nr:tetratricopeptide repeat protein [Verrucomicrobiae bacterium]